MTIKPSIGVRMEVTKSLYGISQDLIFELSHLDESNPEAIAKLETELLTKVDNVAGFIDYLKDQVELAAAKERKLKEIKNALNAKLEWMQAYCVKTLDHANKTAVIGHNKEIKLRVNPMSVEIEDADKIPPEFIDLKQELVVNKKKILEHVKETGEQVQGVNIKRTKSITIKEVLK